MWTKIKQRMNKNRRKVIRQKAVTGMELVGAGAALTGGSILMEKMVDSEPSPQLSGHDNIYAVDLSPSFIKIESLASKEDMSALKITGWVVFGIILILLSIPVIHAILRIMRTCRQSTASYTLDNSPPQKEPEESYSIKYMPRLPEIIKDLSNLSKSKDMEEAWEDMDRNPDSTVDDPDTPPTHEDIAARNASAIKSMKRNVQMFRNMHDMNNSEE